MSNLCRATTRVARAEATIPPVFISGHGYPIPEHRDPISDVAPMAHPIDNTQYVT